MRCSDMDQSARVLMRDMTLRLRERDLDWSEFEDEIVAIDAAEGMYLAIQGSGAVLWRLLALSTTRDALVEALVASYEVDATRAGDDVDGFLAKLDERGLLAS